MSLAIFILPRISQRIRPAQWIAEILPLTHFIRLVRGIMLRSAGMFELSRELLALVAFATVAMTFAVLRFRKRLD